MRNGIGDIAVECCTISENILWIFRKELKAKVKRELTILLLEPEYAERKAENILF